MLGVGGAEVSGDRGVHDISRGLCLLMQFLSSGILQNWIESSRGSWALAGTLRIANLPGFLRGLDFPGAAPKWPLIAIPAVTAGCFVSWPTFRKKLE